MSAHGHPHRPPLPLPAREMDVFSSPVVQWCVLCKEGVGRRAHALDWVVIQAQQRSRQLFIDKGRENGRALGDARWTVGYGQPCTRLPSDASHTNTHAWPKG